MKLGPNRRVGGVRNLTLALLCATLSAGPCVAANTVLRMQTDLGGVNIELFDAAAPNTVLNFLKYVNADYYSGTFLSRRTDPSAGFEVLQMGGFVFDPSLGVFTDNSGIYHIPTDLTNPPLELELGTSNTRGTLAMARGSATNSATSEFFINLSDNNIDDPTADPPRDNLDTLNGGYAVFGQVIAGMDVIDAIAALQRCMDIGNQLPAPCNNFPEVPLIDVTTVNNAGGQFTQPIQQANLVNFLNIGTDSDNDGIIDKIEDAAPNAGDGNGDSLPDSSQASVASFTSSSGGYVTLETSPGISLSDTVVLGNTYFLTTQDPGNVLDQIVFTDSIMGATLTGVTAGGTATVDVSLPATSIPNAYFLYGATPTDSQPHWYDFSYDGETGAELSGNHVVLHFVDGKRGDNDLQVNGVIGKSPGAPARRPGDSDGVPDAVENAAPNGGDGNGDNIPDSTQDYVASLPDLRGDYVTVESVSPAFALSSVKISAVLSSTPSSLPAWMNGLNLVNGFLKYGLNGLNPGGTAEVRLLLPAGETPVTYVKYGPEPGTPTDHFYDFTYDPATGTGAEINGNVITLHFVDGGRGDSDLTADGVISDLGAPAIPAPVAAPSGGSGGCALRTTAGSPWQTGAWGLLALWLLAVAARRRRCASAGPRSAG